VAVLSYRCGCASGSFGCHQIDSFCLTPLKNARGELVQSEDFGGNTPTSNEHAQRSQAGKDRFDEHEPIFNTV
jgi:hypothetical protein